SFVSSMPIASETRRWDRPAPVMASLALIAVDPAGRPGLVGRTYPSREPIRKLLCLKVRTCDSRCSCTKDDCAVSLVLDGRSRHRSQPRGAPMTDSLHSRMHVVSDETRNLVNLVLEYSRRRTLAEDTPLDHPTSEAELRRLAGPTVTEEGLGSARALAIFEHIFAPACISTDHPKYLSFIPSAPTKAAVAFDLVVSASALYGGSWLEGAGVVHAENEVLRWLAGEFGLPETAGGVFVQGGTIGNLSALVAARNAKKEQLGESRPARWVIVCSAEAESSVASAAEVMDVDVAPVATGDDGILRPEGVRQALAEHGDAVIAVVATSGTTNFGTIDDIAGIAALKEEVDFWLHIDGAYGLAAMLAPQVRHRFAGVERADSLIVDPHKWLFAPFDACALIYRDPNIGRRAHTQRAEYLDTLTEAQEWSPSDFAIQLTRRPRGLPLWYSLA